jgi:NAD(P)-dependent dehydrogenase (short-subunit alcohol dehydrogenase family)
MFDFSARPLAGKKGVILGIANEHSIAYGCAQAFRGLGADVAVTYANDKARPFVEPLAKVLEAPIFLPCDVRVLGQLENVFQVAEQPGESSILRFTQSPWPRSRISTVRSRSALETAFCRRWRCLAIPSYAWLILPRH